MSLPSNCEVLDGLLTCGDVVKLFKRSDQTLAIWRKSRALPYVQIPSDERPTIRYRLESLVRWSMNSGFELDEQQLQHLRQRGAKSQSKTPAGRRRFPPSKTH